MWAAQMLADTLAVRWEWALLALLTVTSGLIPEDRIEPAQHSITPVGCALAPKCNQHIRSSASCGDCRGLHG